MRFLVVVNGLLKMGSLFRTSRANDFGSILDNSSDSTKIKNWKVLTSLLKFEHRELNGYLLLVDEVPMIARRGVVRTTAVAAVDRIVGILFTNMDTMRRALAAMERTVDVEEIIAKTETKN